MAIIVGLDLLLAKRLPEHGSDDSSDGSSGAARTAVRMAPR